MFHVPAHLSSFIEANIYRTTTRLPNTSEKFQATRNLCVAVAFSNDIWQKRLTSESTQASISEKARQIRNNE